MRALVHVQRNAQGAVWARVQAVLPRQDLGRVPLLELPVLLEALLDGTGESAAPQPGDVSAGSPRPGDAPLPL